MWHHNKRKRNVSGECLVTGLVCFLLLSYQSLYFTAFPNEAEQYIENIAEQERIKEERFKEMYGYLYNEVYDEDFEYYEDDEEINDYIMYEIVSNFVNNLTVPELRFRLIEALLKLYGKDFPNIFSSI